MRFSSSALVAVLSLSGGCLTLPLYNASPVDKRGALTARSYNDFQVSDGVAGNALAQVNDEFPVDQSNLASVSASDLAIITKAAQVSEDAESAFNDALDGVSSTSAAGIALQNGKIKNKVLKLQTDILRIQIEQAQGKTGLDDELSAQQTKLNKNVSTDKAATGQKSTSVSFDGTD